MPHVDPADVAEHLRALLDAIDAGTVDATATERAYIAGALDVAERLSQPSDVH